jgi:hypothetical protein
MAQRQEVAGGASECIPSNRSSHVSASLQSTSLPSGRTRKKLTELTLAASAAEEAAAGVSATAGALC